MKLLFSVLFILFVAACSGNIEYPTPESVINSNAEFLTQEDIEGAMSTIHPESAMLTNTENIMKQLFETYDLNYKIEKIEVVKNDSNEAEVDFVQLTTKISGPEFRNNRLTGKHFLKKHNNSWKIFITKATNIEYLN